MSPHSNEIPFGCSGFPGGGAARKMPSFFPERSSGVVLPDEQECLSPKALCAWAEFLVARTKGSGIPEKANRDECVPSREACPLSVMLSRPATSPGCPLMSEDWNILQNCEESSIGRFPMEI
jgi:hypothetical protein